MAKRNTYRQGAVSSTDAVRSLKQAAEKCDLKWMRAHAASARFFGATEAEIRRAESVCKARGVGGLKGTGPQHAARAKEHFRVAEDELEWATSPALTDSRSPLYGTQTGVLSKALRHISAGMANCDWVTTKKAAQACKTEELRLLRKLAAFRDPEGRATPATLMVTGFALDGVRLPKDAAEQSRWRGRRGGSGEDADDPWVGRSSRSGRSGGEWLERERERSPAAASVSLTFAEALIYTAEKETSPQKRAYLIAKAQNHMLTAEEKGAPPARLARLEQMLAEFAQKKPPKKTSKKAPTKKGRGTRGLGALNGKSRAGLTKSGKLKKGCRFLKGGRVSCETKGLRLRLRG